MGVLMGYKLILILGLFSFGYQSVAQMSSQDLIFEEPHLLEPPSLSNPNTIQGQNTNTNPDKGILTIQHYHTIETPVNTPANEQEENNNSLGVSTLSDETQRCNEFKSKGTQILRKLIANNTSTIGSLNLHKVLEAIENTVSVEFINTEDNSQGEGQFLTTLFSKWQKDSKNMVLIYVDSILWSQISHDKDLQEVLALSEVISAVGLFDNNYFLSSSLWLLSKNTETSFISINEKRILLSELQAYLREVYKYTEYINELKREALSVNNSNDIKEFSYGSYLFGPAAKIHLIKTAIEAFKRDPTPENKSEIIRLYKIPFNQLPTVERFMAFYKLKIQTTKNRSHLSHLLG